MLSEYLLVFLKINEFVKKFHLKCLLLSLCSCMSHIESACTRVARMLLPTRQRDMILLAWIVCH